MTWLQHEGWRALLEITILTLGIYFMIKIIRGTRGAPVVTGFVLFLPALALVTTLLDLRVLSLILRNFFGFFVLAVIVIFQPEFRRILAELGTLPFLTNVREQRENIEVLIKTVERLADVRIGMLVGIEQSTPLQDVVESGVLVDCEATPEMLETIFFPNNAIHDGGVILRGDRITHAACIFPLTQRKDLSKSLGTRHRAAIGLSEETDAVVVVVSEETGAISYAYRGQLVRGVTSEELRAFLSSVLLRETSPGARRGRWRLLRGDRTRAVAGNPPPQKPTDMRWREVITHNLAWKLLSLFLAVGIYAMIESGVQEQFKPGPRRVFPALPIRTLSPAGDAHLTRLEPDHVEVTLSGPATLDQLRPEDVDVYISLLGITNGANQSFNVQVRAPTGITVVSVKPAEVTARVLPGGAASKPR